MHEALALLETLRSVLAAEASLDAETLAIRAGTTASAPGFQTALRHLDDHLEILVDPLTRMIRGRARLTTDVVDALAAIGPATQSALRAHLKIDVAPLAEVLGWLQREGRLEFLTIDGVESARLKRGSSGPQPVVDD